MGPAAIDSPFDAQHDGGLLYSGTIRTPMNTPLLTPAPASTPAVRRAWIAPLILGASLMLPGCAALQNLRAVGAEAAPAPTASTSGSAGDAAAAPAPTDVVTQVPPTAIPQAVLEATPPPTPVGLVLEPGVYRCELERSVGVKSLTRDGQTMELRWNRKEYAMHAVEARSGALRYENREAGLAWITIVGKSLLLDTRQGQQLANECKYAIGVAYENMDPPAPTKTATRSPRKATAKK